MQQDGRRGAGRDAVQQQDVDVVELAERTSTSGRRQLRRRRLSVPSSQAEPELLEDYLEVSGGLTAAAWRRTVSSLP